MLIEFSTYFWEQFRKPSFSERQQYFQVRVCFNNTNLQQDREGDILMRDVEKGVVLIEVVREQSQVTMLSKEGDRVI